jgi:hypothetical protein
MDAIGLALLPRHIDVRIVRYTVARRGYRTRHVLIATTLMDQALWPDARIAELYGHRWQIEVCQPYCLHCHTFDESLGQGLGRVRSAA